MQIIAFYFSKRIADVLYFFLKRGGYLSGDKFIKVLKETKIVNVVKEEKHIDKLTSTDSKVVFLLTGNITNIKTYVDYIKSINKLVFIHLEMIGGLNCNNEGLHFIARYVKPAGIITTKKNIVTLAKKYKLLTVKRIFAIDTDAVNSSIEVIKEIQPDLVEIMPSRMPEIIRQINDSIEVPVIAGGLIKTKKHIEDALNVGAIAVASGTPAIWLEKHD